MLVESCETALILMRTTFLFRFLEHWVERIRLGPAVYWRVGLVRNGSPRVDGAFRHVRIDPQA